MSDFRTLGISAELVGKLQESGISKPTPIQEQAIPYVMERNDLIAQAQTGTGKTFAFILPILEKMNREATSIQALIVTPTRELALQITTEIKKLIADIDGLDVLAVYGGQDVDKQLKKLNKNVQIVVGTPGRLLDHIGRGTVQLSELSYLVLDEADQMLHIGFFDEVEKIIRETPTTRQTMLFSATMPEEIRRLARKHMRKPEYVQVEKTQGPADNVKQMAIHTVDRAKQNTLIELVKTHRPFLAVIFCRTKRRVSKLYDGLKGKGFSCDELHGDLSQAKREQVMKRFREAEIQLLIATDVAARGLDVEGVTHVFNYDIPLDAESYVHRIGRTGRAGMTGLAITLYSSKDRPILDEIEAELNIRIDKKNIGNIENEEKTQGDSSQPLKARRRNSQKGKRGNARPLSGKDSGKNRDERPRTEKKDEGRQRRSRRKGDESPQSRKNEDGRSKSRKREQGEVQTKKTHRKESVQDNKVEQRSKGKSVEGRRGNMNKEGRNEGRPEGRTTTRSTSPRKSERDSRNRMGGNARKTKKR